MESSGCAVWAPMLAGSRARSAPPPAPTPGRAAGWGRLEKAGAAAAWPGAEALAVMEGLGRAQRVAWAVVPGRVNLAQP